MFKFGEQVSYVIDGQTVFTGTYAYTTHDGWVGIRIGQRVDEVSALYVRAA